MEHGTRIAVLRAIAGATEAIDDADDDALVECLWWALTQACRSAPRTMAQLQRMLAWVEGQAQIGAERLAARRVAELAAAQQEQTDGDHIGPRG